MSRPRFVNNHIALAFLALVYLGIGDRARAIDYFEKAYDANSQLLACLA